MKLLSIASVRLTMKQLFFVLTIALFCCALQAAETNNILAGLRPEHPRLILTAGDWATLRAERGGTNEVARVLATAENNARTLLNQPPVIYKKDGKRLLAVSREAMRRIELWSFAYKLTGDKIFLNRAEKEMLTVAAFSDWNPSHFLDVAEMTAGMALGYDWLYDALSPATRATVRQAILEKGLKPGIALHGTGWQRALSNWNQVCFGGLTLGALAIADEESTAATELLTLVRDDNHFGMAAYAPDGVYPEGPGYWSYGTGYEVLLISALESALGTDWNLSATPGFLDCAAAQMELTGPTGRPFNFSDGPNGNPIYQPWQFWFAKKMNEPWLVYFQIQRLQEYLANPRPNVENDRVLPWLAEWLAALPEKIPVPELPIAWHADGHNPVGVFRTSWTDTNALFLAFKGGAASNSHGHMDAGSFVLDAQGVRWACDFGSQDYLSIESKGWDLWSAAQNSDRWRVFRLNNFSHNTLTLGGKLHNAAGRAEIAAFHDNSAMVNLTAVFTPQAKSVVRHFNFASDKVVIRDEISGADAGLSVRWQMLTRADIQIENGHATLHQNGRTLRAKIISPAGAEFEKASAQPPDDGVNKANPGYAMLQLNTIVPVSRNLTVEIELRPEPLR
jgi:hypothetical protein